MRVLRRSGVQDLGWTSLLSLVILGPLLLGRGFWLVGDMVFVPRQPWKDEWLGGGPGAPRSVPMDALVSLATRVVPGDLLQHGLLLGAFLLGGLGAGRLVSGHPPYARLAAISLALWNPWVHDRLMMGQWAIMAGYFALPWVVVAAARLRQAPRARAAVPMALGFAAVLLAAVFSPATGLMAGVVLTVVAAGGGWGRRLLTAAVAVMANLVWLVPSFTGSGALTSQPAVFAVFGARGESSLGVVASLLSLGGTWKSAIVAPERASALIVAVSVGLTVAAVLGVRRSVTWRDDPTTVRRLAWLAAGALALAITPILPGTRAAWTTLDGALPQLAFFRDAQRFLAPAVLLLLPGIAGACTWLRSQIVSGRGSLWAVVGLLVVGPVLLLPSLAWGGQGTLDRVQYPGEWQQVSTALEAAERADPEVTTVVVPWRGSYRGFDWNPGHAVLDPAPRFFPGEVLVDDRIEVDGAAVAAEDPRTVRIDEALRSAAPGPTLSALGVDYVLVEGSPAVAGVAPEAIGRVVHAGRGLVLIAVAEPATQGGSGGVTGGGPDVGGSGE